jgi:hypothetical protein
MATSGQPLGDEEFVAYVLTGMDEECYNPLVSSLSLELRRSRLSSYTRRNLAMSIASTDNLVATPSSPSTLHPVAMAHFGSSATPPVQGMTVVVRVALSAALPCWPLNFRRGPSTDAASGQNRPRCQVCLKTIQAIRLMCAGSSLMKILFMTTGLLLWHHPHLALMIQIGTWTVVLQIILLVSLRSS